MQSGPIGIFDSGYGGLTILHEIIKELPEYDFVYLGDNARTPYGTRSYETIYQYTLECINYLFDHNNCPLIILACNTASAKALRSIQMRNLPEIAPANRVLGVIRPTAETIGNFSKSGHIGILGTTGTVNSESYLIEIAHQFPTVKVYQQACPLWVPLIENGELDSAGTEYFVQKYLEDLFNQCAEIDTILLACTHYPLLMPVIHKYLPKGVKVIDQGTIVAPSLKDYLNRHPEISSRCSKNAGIKFFTTDSNTIFDAKALNFFGQRVISQLILI